MQVLKSMSATQKLFLIFAIALNIATVLFIPSHPDDFSTYHALACGFPSQHLNVFHAPCNTYFHDFGPLHYQQDYEYVGVANSLVMRIFTLLFTPLVSHYLWGLLALVITSIGLVKSFKLDSHWIIILFYIPVTYPILHDDSPIRFSIIFFAWTPFLFRKAFANQEIKRILFLLLISFGWLLSTEDKPFFVYLIPGLFFLHLALDQKSVFHSKMLYLKRGIIYAALFIPTLIFLAFSRMGDKSYLLYLADNNQTFTRGYFRSISTAFLHLFSWFAFPVRAVDYNYAPGKVQPESAEALPWGNGVTSIFSILILAITAYLFFRFYGRIVKSLFQERKSEIWNFNLLATVSVLLLLVFPILGGAWSGHHFVFAHVAILIILIRNIEIFTKKKAEQVIVFLGIATILLTSLTPARSYNSKESRQAIDFAYKAATPHTVINCAYSCYYEYSLRNIREIPVTFATNSEEGSRLSLYIKSNKLKLIHICKLCSAKSTSEIFGYETKSEALAHFGQWKVYSVSFNS